MFLILHVEMGPETLSLRNRPILKDFANHFCTDFIHVIEAHHTVFNDLGHRSSTQVQFLAASRLVQNDRKP